MNELLLQKQREGNTEVIDLEEDDTEFFLSFWEIHSASIIQHTVIAAEHDTLF